LTGTFAGPFSADSGLAPFGGESLSQRPSTRGCRVHELV